MVAILEMGEAVMANLRIVRGDITQIPADAIVNAANQVYWEVVVLMGRFTGRLGQSWMLHAVD